MVAGVRSLEACSFCAATSPRIKRVELDDGRVRCMSMPGCVKRMHARVGIKLVLDRDLDELDLAAADKAEAERKAREIRNERYRRGMCVDCGRIKQSPGRPRCEACHAELVAYRKLGFA